MATATFAGPLPIPEEYGVTLAPLDETDPFQEISVWNQYDCTITIGEDYLKPAPFSASHRLERTNEFALRFGAPDDMIDLVAGSNEEQIDYVWGLVATSIFVAIFILVWSIVICVLRWTGYKRVGFLCGRFVRPPPPLIPRDEASQQLAGKEEEPLTSNDEENEEEQDKEQPVVEEARITSEISGEGMEVEEASVPVDESEHKLEQEVDEPLEKDELADEQSKSIKIENGSKQQEYREFCRRQDTRLKRTRIAVVVSAFLIIVNCILFCIYGNRYLAKSLGEVEVGLKKIRDLCFYGIKLIDLFVFRQTQVSSTNQGAMRTLDGICPLVRESLCESIEPTVSNCTFQDIPIVAESLEKLIGLIDNSKSYLFDELFKLRSDLQTLYDDVDQMLDNSFQLEWSYWVSFAFTLALGTQCVVIIWAVHMAHMGRGGKLFRFYRRNVVFPIFVFFVVMAFIFACCFIIAAVGASDWCINSPDPKVSFLLEKNQDYLDSVVFQYAMYYVNGCATELAPFLFSEQLNLLVNVLEGMGKFADTLRNVDPVEWNEACGTDVSLLAAVADGLERTSCLYGETLEDINELFWCRNWSPIYTTFMHQAIW
uniref:Uncharacterized protein n=1 Tax=Entomoneis paludosa TaxID=265537 RepID=A0A7S2Y970_9STRA|mmetsp:Transcript_23297/g.48411  ORF Transcript_23297/g.48411 Transcript_23297/m.48411 type:complete len:598 (+) Transcript_23297:155-1948(+)